MHLIDMDSLKELKRELNAALTYKDVRRQLRVTNATLPKLVRSGLLDALRGPTVDGSSHWRFSRDTVDNLFEKIRERIPRTPPPHSGREMSFNNARSILRLNIVDFIKAILGKEITPCRESSEDGLKRFQFKVEDVLIFKRGMRTEATS